MHELSRVCGAIYIFFIGSVNREIYPPNKALVSPVN